MHTEYKIETNIKIISVMSAFEVIYNNDFFFGGENHNFWEFVYVIDGKVGATADEKIHELSKNEIIFHKPMEFHKLWASSGTKPHLFIMSFSSEGQLMNRFKDGVFTLTYEQKTKFDMLLDSFQLHTENKILTTATDEFLKSWNNDPVFTQLIGNYLEIFLLSLVDNQKVTTTGQLNKSAMYYTKIIKVMEEHVYEWITVPQLGELLNLSVSNLKKIFVKYSMYSIHKYFLKLKINQAIELLKNGYTVLEISELLSFNNQNYFSIVFKRETGYSPLSYKKKFLIES